MPLEWKEQALLFSKSAKQISPFSKDRQTFLKKILKFKNFFKFKNYSETTI
jgi:hypothetical protein